VATTVGSNGILARKFIALIIGLIYGAPIHLYSLITNSPFENILFSEICEVLTVKHGFTCSRLFNDSLLPVSMAVYLALFICWISSRVNNHSVKNYSNQIQHFSDNESETSDEWDYEEYQLFGNWVIISSKTGD